METETQNQSNLNLNLRGETTERYIMFLILCGHKLDFIMQETGINKIALQTIISSPLFKQELHNLLLKVHAVGEKHLVRNKSLEEDASTTLVQELAKLNIQVPSEVVLAIDSASKILSSNASSSVKNQAIRLILDFYSKVLAKLNMESASDEQELAKLIHQTFREEEEKFKEDQKQDQPNESSKSLVN